MSGNSRIVHSSQESPHPHLLRQLARHCGAPFQKPVATHTRAAFNHLRAKWQGCNRAPLVLDAGCGTGRSSLLLAQRHADCLVVGVDQSADRLLRGPLMRSPFPDNLLLLRADVVDIWRLLAAEGMKLAFHYLLYPNPWPKKQHLGRRWHGHPAFPVLPALGGLVECRSNWRIYVEEFAAAMTSLSGVPARMESWNPDRAMLLTPFEEKYAASGHGLWRCRLDLSGTCNPLRRATVSGIDRKTSPCASYLE